MTFTWRQQLEAQLTAEEGNRLKPYTDTKGKITIGRGRNLTDVGISAAESDLLFTSDIDRAVLDCMTIEWWPDLDPVRRVAVADLVFNLGLAKLKTFTTFMSLMAAGKYIPAGHDLATTLWASEVGPTRSNRIVEQILEGTT